MQTVDYIDLVTTTAHKCGFQPEAVPTAEWATLRLLLGESIRAAWEEADWPFLRVTEERWYRPFWDETATYAANDEVFLPLTQKYYQSLAGTNTGNWPVTDSGGGVYVINGAWWAELVRAPTADDYDVATAYEVGDQVYYALTDRVYQCIAISTGNAPTDTDYWAELIPFNSYVAYDQPGKTAFDDCLGAFPEDPRIRADARVQPLTADLSAEGVQILEEVPSAWLVLRLRPPQLTGETWSATATYAVGEQVYFASGTSYRGDFYDCTEATAAGESPATAAAKWSVVEIPADFTAYASAAAAAEWWRPRRSAEALMTSDREARAADRALARLLGRYFSQNVESRQPMVGTR